VTQDATLMLTAKPVATLPILNAMIPLVFANHAIEAQIQIAQKQRPSAMLVARFTTTAKLSATRPQESAKNATHNIVERDVFQRTPAINNANQTHIMTSNMNASGKLILQCKKSDAGTYSEKECNDACKAPDFAKCDFKNNKCVGCTVGKDKNCMYSLDYCKIMQERGKCKP
jgi:hypothetical protein